MIRQSNMKKYMPKFPFYTIVYILICFYFHWYKETILLFAIILFHEYAHVIVAKCLNYEIEGVIVYPFGAMAQIKDYGYHRNIEDLWVAMSGLCSHLFLLTITRVFAHFFGTHLTNLYIQFNYQILCFNLLPIYPMDGLKIIQCLLSYFIDYLKTLQISVVCSYVGIFLLVRFAFLWQNIFVYSFLFIHTVIYHKNYYYYYLKFLFSRKDDFKRKPIIHKRKVFYKNKQNYYLKKDEIINEKTAIKSGFFIDNRSIWW